MNVASVFAQMRSDTVAAGFDAKNRSGDRVRFAMIATTITRLANSGDMVDVDSELQHGAIIRKTSAIANLAGAQVCRMV